MSINADNIFIAANDPSQVTIALRQSAVAAGRKYGISAPVNGWVQVIDSHSETPPALAREISEALSSLVVLAQLYEVTGHVGWAVFQSGKATETMLTEDSGDPAGDMQVRLRRLGIHSSVLSFSAAEPWRSPGWSVLQL